MKKKNIVKEALIWGIAIIVCTAVLFAVGTAISHFVELVASIIPPVC